MWIVAIKRNGHTVYGAQNYQCKKCSRQFVEDSRHVSVAQQALIKRLLLVLRFLGDQRDIQVVQQALIKRLLLERVSLRGICRVAEVSLTWLLTFITEVYAELSADLKVKVSEARGMVHWLLLSAEADEMWSFVARKENKQ